MAPSLPFGLEPRLRETPLDYVSRLACRNHRDAVRLLCSDFGIRLAAVAAGHDKALAAVAMLGRTDPAALAAEAIRPLPRRRLLWRGHELPAVLVSRQRARLCPACALGDVAGGSGREEARPWRRGEWLLRDVHACPVHGLGLVDLGAQRDPRAPDFATALRLARGPSALADRALPLPPTGLELYVLVRFGALTASGPPSPFLDALPLHACLRLSEVVGAVAIDGPNASMTGVPAPLLRERQREGFEIVRGGEGPLREFLERLLSAFGRRGGKPGPQALFGRLYLWLAHPALDPSLAPVRDVVRDFAFDRLAIGPGDAVAPFGHRLPERRLHSIRSASVEYGIHPATLRNLLVADGAVVSGPPSASDDLTTFDARLHSGRLAEFADALDLVAAAAHLGLSAGLLEALVRDGLVVPFLGGASSAFRHYRFRRTDLDAFIESLAADLPSNDVLPLRPVVAAARAAGCSVTDVVRLLREGRLVRVARSDGIGIGSVLVDPDEIRTCRSRPQADLVHPAEVRERTGLPLHVVRALVRHGALRGARHANPVTGVLRLMVERADFDRFSADHVSLAELARKQNVPPGLLWNRLSAKGSAPAMSQRLVGAVIYRRADLPDRKELHSLVSARLKRRPAS